MKNGYKWTWKVLEDAHKKGPGMSWKRKIGTMGMLVREFEAGGGVL